MSSRPFHPKLERNDYFPVDSLPVCVENVRTAFCIELAVMATIMQTCFFFKLTLTAAPTDVDAVLSPRVCRRGSGRIRTTSQSSNRPSSAGDVTSHSVDSLLHDVKCSADGDSDAAAAVAISSSGYTSCLGDSCSAQSAASPSTSSDDAAVSAMAKPLASSRSTPNAAVVVDALSVDNETTSAEDDILNTASAPPGASHTGEAPSNSNNNHSAVETGSSDTSFGGADKRKPPDYVEKPDPDLSCEVLHSASAVSLTSSDITSIEAELLAQAMPQSTKVKRKMRLSAGKSETILPTGSRTVRGAKSRPSSSETSSKADGKSEEGASGISAMNLLAIFSSCLSCLSWLADLYNLTMLA